LSRADLVGQAGIKLIFVALAALLIAAGRTLLARRHHGATRKGDSPVGVPMWACWLAIAAVVAVIGVWLSLMLGGVAFGKEVRSHTAIREDEPRWLRIFLDVHADPIQATWVNKRPQGVQDTPSLLFLGQSGAVTVLYDGQSHQTLRVPTGTVMLSRIVN
jgi:hypothetical protein